MPEPFRGFPLGQGRANPETRLNFGASQALARANRVLIEIRQSPCAFGMTTVTVPREQKSIVELIGTIGAADDCRSDVHGSRRIAIIVDPALMAGFPPVELFSRRTNAAVIPRPCR